MAVKNMTASVLARLKQWAKEEGMTFQAALQLFSQEEFLRKLAESQYAEKMILKGGMFIYMITEFESRPTRDIDFMIHNISRDVIHIQDIMKEICHVNTGNDFITMEVLGVEQITVDKKYPGVRTKFLSYIGKVKTPFSVDVGIDDIIVPGPIKRKMITAFPDFTAPEIYTYSLESTIAEKLDAILQRMEGTSRMKDFYDIYYLSGMFNFDGETLLEAVRLTLGHRQRELHEEAFKDIAEFDRSEFLNIQWKAFVPAREMGLEFKAALERLSVFLRPVYECVLNGRRFQAKWNCERKNWGTSS